MSSLENIRNGSSANCRAMGNIQNSTPRSWQHLLRPPTPPTENSANPDLTNILSASSTTCVCCSCCSPWQARPPDQLAPPPGLGVTGRAASVASCVRVQSRRDAQPLPIAALGQEVDGNSRKEDHKRHAVCGQRPPCFPSAHGNPLKSHWDAARGP